MQELIYLNNLKPLCKIFLMSEFSMEWEEGILKADFQVVNSFKAEFMLFLRSTWKYPSPGGLDCGVLPHTVFFNLK